MSNKPNLGYYRPLVQSDLTRPIGAKQIANGPYWFSHAEHLVRGGAAHIVPASDIPVDIFRKITQPRPPLCGLGVDRPVIMGILNVTPDSFSDGGQHNDISAAVNHAQQMVDDGADIIDIGGESTRPGAATVPEDIEIARTQPVIAALRAALGAVISIDTRKTSVATAAHAAGANIVNDVSGFTYDADLAPYCGQNEVPVCVMHTQGDPETMHHDPHYDDVLLDVYDFLEAQVAFLEKAGIPAGRIIVDPGIGFGKTQAHNLAILNRISLFHGLGCPILLGASRKKFIKTIGGAQAPESRVSGSISVALAAMAQGVQILRVHDVAETQQAIKLWQTIREGAA